MRPAAALACLALSACARGHCAQRPSPPPEPAAATTLSRLEREPAPRAVTTPSERLVFHAVRLDEHGLLLPATEHDDRLAEVPRLGFRAFAAMPDAPNGKKPYFSASMFIGGDDAPFTPHDWLFNPAGLAAMLVRSGLRWYAWSGDRAPADAARALVDHILSHGLTRDADAWSRVPYASANGGDLEYGGGDDARYCEKHDACGRGDGRGFLEPDKVGELGHALVLLHRFTGEAAYLDAAARWADQLAAHVAPGDGARSPWPFRVDAATGTVVREPYTSNWVYTIAFLDELRAAGRATDAHARARDAAWSWLSRYPLSTMHWQGFFEDIPIFASPGDNPNQYSAGETARWLLDHPDDDPDAVAHARAIADWIAATFAVDTDAPGVGATPGHWHGADVISEQRADMAKMGSHTARYASLLARLYEASGDGSLRARARRSFAWATYCIDPRGVVKVGPDDREGYWFSDGYGDYLVHFLDGMAAVPAWAPAAEAHVLRTDDVLVDVDYAASSLRYRGTARGREQIRVPAAPKRVSVGDGATYDVEPIPEGGALVTVHRTAAQPVAIEW
jgi:hypothetical protein